MVPNELTMTDGLGRSDNAEDPIVFELRSKHGKWVTNRTELGIESVHPRRSLLVARRQWTD